MSAAEALDRLLGRVLLALLDRYEVVRGASGRRGAVDLARDVALLLLLRRRDPSVLVEDFDRLLDEHLRVGLDAFERVSARLAPLLAAPPSEDVAERIARADAACDALGHSIAERLVAARRRAAGGNRPA